MMKTIIGSKRRRLIKGFIFDWSGVVMDEIRATGLAHLEVIKALGGIQTSYEEWRTQIGSDWKDFYLRKGVGKAQLGRALTLFKNEYNKFDDLVKPTFNVSVVLSEIKHAGYKTAVLSNQERSIVLETATRFDLLKYFDLIVTSEDLTKHKPNPDSLRQVLEMFNLKPFEAALLEDMREGIEMGNQVGVLTIGVRSDLEHDLSMSDIYIESIIDLLKVFNLPANKV